MTTGKPDVSIVIATRNRKEQLSHALDSCLAQEYQALEVVVLDDASTDGTSAMVAGRFPQIRYFREGRAIGIAAMRNRGFAEARGAYVLSIDDDAYFTDVHTVGQVVEEFERAPEAAVLAMPFVEPFRPGVVSQQILPEVEKPIRFKSYIACAYGIRRDIALHMGGYREFFFYRGEERDLSIRLLNAGHAILYVRTPPVVHLFSPKREWSQMYSLGIRNTLLFDILNIPHPYVLPRLAIDCGQLLLHKITPGQFSVRFLYVARGLCACVKYARLRHAVSRATYHLYRSLPSHGPAQFIQGSMPLAVRRS